jgi:hypothetical protein
MYYSYRNREQLNLKSQSLQFNYFFWKRLYWRVETGQEGISSETESHLMSGKLQGLQKQELQESSKRHTNHWTKEQKLNTILRYNWPIALEHISSLYRGLNPFSLTVSSLKIPSTNQRITWYSSTIKCCIFAISHQYIKIKMFFSNLLENLWCMLISMYLVLRWQKLILTICESNV